MLPSKSLRKAPRALSSQLELSRPASPHQPGQERVGRKPEAPRFGQAERPPPPSLPSRSPLSLFSWHITGENRRGRFGGKSVQGGGAEAPHLMGKDPQGGSGGREGRGRGAGRPEGWGPRAPPGVGPRRESPRRLARAAHWARTPEPLQGKRARPADATVAIWVSSLLT